MNEQRSCPSDSSTPASQQKPGKRAKRKQSYSDRQNNKRRRDAGLDFVTRRGVTKEGKEFLQVTSCCQKNCHEKFTYDDQLVLWISFYDKGTKSMQDEKLSGFMTWKLPKTHRRDASKSINNVWNYSLRYKVRK